MARVFNGSNQSLTRTESLFSGSTTSYNWTLVAWCRPDDKHEGTIIGADEQSGSNGRFSLFSRNVGRFALRRKSGYIQEPSASYDNGNTDWFHVAGTWQYAYRELYVDGASRVTQSSNISLNPAKATKFYIGRDWSGKYWDGAIAEAAAYSVALSASEISALAAGFSPLLVRPESLIGYWPLGGALASDTGDIDLINGKDLTANNSPTTENHPQIIYPASPSLVLPSAAEPVTADGSVSEYARTPDTSGSFTKPYDTSSTYLRDTDTTGTFTRPSE